MAHGWARRTRAPYTDESPWVTEDVADDTGALDGGFVEGVAMFVHGVEDAAVDGLEAVAHLWEGSGYDD